MLMHLFEDAGQSFVGEASQKAGRCASGSGRAHRLDQKQLDKPGQHEVAAGLLVSRFFSHQPDELRHPFGSLDVHYCRQLRYQQSQDRGYLGMSLTDQRNMAAA